MMEFLLINVRSIARFAIRRRVPVADLAVGYGGSALCRPKRVVFHKSMGPLISAEEMTRCIHVRSRALWSGSRRCNGAGMAGRGEYAEILSFVGSSVDSELSGNMIDPPGRRADQQAAATATLGSRRVASISPHDSLGSNLIAGEEQRSDARSAFGKRRRQRMLAVGSRSLLI